MPEMPYLAFVNLTPVTGLTRRMKSIIWIILTAPAHLMVQQRVYRNGQSFSFDIGIVAVIQSRDAYSQGPLQGVK